MTNLKTKPVFERRDSAVKIAVWANQSEKGVFYSVDLTRTYTDENDEPQSSHSFTGADILKAQRLLGKAYDAIEQMRAKDRVEERLAES